MTFVYRKCLVNMKCHMCHEMSVIRNGLPTSCFVTRPASGGGRPRGGWKAGRLVRKCLGRHREVGLGSQGICISHATSFDLVKVRSF